MTWQHVVGQFAIVTSRKNGSESQHDSRLCKHSGTNRSGVHVGEVVGIGDVGTRDGAVEG